VQNFVLIGPVFFSPHMGEISLLRFGYYFVFLVLQLACSRGPHTDLHVKYVKDAVARKDMPFGVLKIKSNV